MQDIKPSFKFIITTPQLPCPDYYSPLTYEADSASGNWGASGSLGLSAQRIVESLNLNRSVFVKDKFPNNVQIVYTEVGKAKRRETKGWGRMGLMDTKVR